MKQLSVWCLVLTLVLAADFPGILAAEDKETEEASTTLAGPLVEKVRVTATRLPDTPTDATKIPAHVTVYTQEEIRRTGAANLQQFLALRSDFVVFDEVGNGVEATADMRGFNTGALATSALVTVNGVRVNEPDTGFVNFELIPLESVERIEVVRGSASATFGEGGLGGVIHVITRRGTGPPGGLARVSGGSYGTQDYYLSSGGQTGKLSYSAGIRRRLSEGFRDNTDTRLTSFQGNLQWDLSARQSLGLDLTTGTNHLNQPGALTQDELSQDRTQNPFNERDFSATDLLLPSLYYEADLGNTFSLSSRLAWRNADEEGFVGGRTGSGSISGVDRRGISWTGQASQEVAFGEGSHLLTFGTEYAHDRFDTGQTRTDDLGNPLPVVNDDGSPNYGHSVSQNSSTRRFLGLFVQEMVSLNPRWSISTGLRWDRIRIESSGDQAFYDFPPPDFMGTFTQQDTGGDLDFSKVSPKLGVNFNPTPTTRFYAGYSRGFRAPTVIELFAFPSFSSNPDLKSSTSDDFEAGWSQQFGDRTLLSLNAFWIDVQDEIFFILTDTNDFTGVNRNLPETQRRGATLTVGSHLSSRAFAEVGATYTDATFQTSFEDANIGNRVEAGDRLPQIPRTKYSARLDLDMPGNWDLSVQDIYVGRQVLSSDLANVSDEIPPYNLLNARISYGHQQWTFFTQIHNLLDREYSSRGIYAFNFNAFAFDQFYTPAPGRTLQTGLEFRY